MRDLNQLLDSSGAHWHIGVATAINNLGQITGAGTAPSGDTHAFLLTPVPEPTSVFLLAVGGLALGLTARRQRSRIPNWTNRERHD
jgi:probable HAF family extracellular repeat protein